MRKRFFSKFFFAAGTFDMFDTVTSPAAARCRLLARAAAKEPLLCSSFGSPR